MKRRYLTLVAMFAAMPSPVLAQGHSHGGHSTPMQRQSSAESPSTKGYRDANTKMHRDMDIAYSGDPDVDFVRGMIPHHQGAIDMAKIALEHSKDEQIRKWATNVIREQEREIAEMQDWLRKKGFN
jgi:uncharacterized protein (DUF305 family)